MSPTLYRVISFDKQLHTGATDTWQVTVSAVAKCNSPAVPYYLPNEHLCGELGRFLRLPIPPCALLLAPDRDVTQWFASLDFNYAGNALPPVVPERVVQHLPDLSTGLVLFDALIGNCDRHPGNLAVDVLTRPTRLFIFDHSHALFGYMPSGAEQRLEGLRDRLAISAGSRTGGNPHCLLRVLSEDTYFDKWMVRIQQLPDYLIDELCEDAVSLGASTAEANSASNFLKHRRDAMRDIIR